MIYLYQITNIREKAYRDEAFAVSSVKNKRHQIRLAGNKLKQTEGVDSLYSDPWSSLPNNSVDARKSTWAQGEIGQDQEGRDIHQELLYTQNCM